MPIITAIAFDLGGVLIKENEYHLSPTEQLLERQFGNINNDETYYQRAIKETGLSKKEIKKIVEHIVVNMYELRTTDIFQKLPKLKLAIASNHLSAIHKWIEKSDVWKYFDYILISADVKVEKPHSAFYQRLIEWLNEKPENILFIDDDSKNIEWAKIAWLQTLLYDRSKNLLEEVLKNM